MTLIYTDNIGMITADKAHLFWSFLRSASLSAFIVLPIRLFCVKGLSVFLFFYIWLHDLFRCFQAQVPLGILRGELQCPLLVDAEVN